MLAKSSLTVLINHPAPIPHLSWAPARDCCVHCTALFEPLAVGPGNPSPNIARIWDEPPPQPLHCTTMFSSPICTVCCTVSCTVYSVRHCTPGSIEDSEAFISNILLRTGLIRSVNPLLYIGVEGKAIDRDFRVGDGVKPSAPCELITKQELVLVYRPLPFATSPNLPDLQKNKLCKLPYSND